MRSENQTSSKPWLFSIAIAMCCYASICSSQQTQYRLDGTFIPKIELTSIFSSQRPSGSRILIQDDGKILLSGGFDRVNGVNVEGSIIRLHEDGKLDTSFLNDTVSKIFALQPDGKILVGAAPRRIAGVTRLNAGIIRLNTDGSQDESFEYQGDVFIYEVNVAVVLANGKILVGGRILTDDRSDSSVNLIRLNSDGTIDNSFIAAIEGASVNSLAVQPNGRILVGGAFDIVNGSENDHLVRLMPDGSTDTTFKAETNIFSGHLISVRDIVVRADRTIFIAGFFTRVNNISQRYLAKINSDGSLDENFKPNINNTVYSIAELDNGSIFVGGVFNQIDGNTKRIMALLLPDGRLDSTLDLTFGIGNEKINDFAMQADGSILFAGSFNLINGINAFALRRLCIECPERTVVTPIYDLLLDEVSPITN